MLFSPRLYKPASPYSFYELVVSSDVLEDNGFKVGEVYETDHDGRFPTPSPKFPGITTLMGDTGCWRLVETPLADDENLWE